MSAGSTNGIGPVSVRYAAQIRELLYTQAVQRAAAEQEAARQADAAEKAARFQPAIDEAPAVKVEADTNASTASHGGEAPASDQTASSAPAPATHINVRA